MTTTDQELLRSTCREPVHEACVCELRTGHVGPHMCARPAEHVAGIVPIQREYEVTATVQVAARSSVEAVAAVVDALRRPKGALPDMVVSVIAEPRDGQGT